MIHDPDHDEFVEMLWEEINKMLQQKMEACRRIMGTAAPVYDIDDFLLPEPDTVVEK